MSASKNPPSQGTDWAIVGGGIVGMNTAERLAAAGNTVTLYEATRDLGGLTAAWSIATGKPDDDAEQDSTTVTWDRFYHVILQSDERVLELLERLGLTPELVWNTSRAACAEGGRIHPASTGMQLATLPFLGFIAKLRIALTVVWASLWKNGQRFDDITSLDWLRRWSGKQATLRFWHPLLQAKLGNQAQEASARFIWSTVRRLGSARKQGKNADLFGHVRGGYATILTRYQQHLIELGVTIKTSTSVRSITRHESGKLSITDANDNVYTHDQVVVTAASPLASRICPQLSAAEHHTLHDVPYLGVVCASLVMKKPLTGAYLTYIIDPAPFTAVVEMTSLVDPKEISGYHLVYLPRYTNPDDELFHADPTELCRSWINHLETMYPDFSAENDLVSSQVATAKYVMPVPTRGYAQRIPPIETSIPGLYLVGSARITDGTLNAEASLNIVDNAFPILQGNRL